MGCSPFCSNWLNTKSENQVNGKFNSLKFHFIFIVLTGNRFAPGTSIRSFISLHTSEMCIVDCDICWSDELISVIAFSGQSVSWTIDRTTMHRLMCVRVSALQLSSSWEACVKNNSDKTRTAARMMGESGVTLGFEQGRCSLDRREMSNCLHAASIQPSNPTQNPRGRRGKNCFAFVSELYHNVKSEIALEFINTRMFLVWRLHNE